MSPIFHKTIHWPDHAYLLGPGPLLYVVTGLGGAEYQILDETAPGGSGYPADGERGHSFTYRVKFGGIDSSRPASSLEAAQAGCQKHHDAIYNAIKLHGGDMFEEGFEQGKEFGFKARGR